MQIYQPSRESTIDRTLWVPDDFTLLCMRCNAAFNVVRRRVRARMPTAPLEATAADTRTCGAVDAAPLPRVWQGRVRPVFGQPQHQQQARVRRVLRRQRAAERRLPGLAADLTALAALAPATGARRVSVPRSCIAEI